MKNYSDAHQDIFAYLINDKKPGFWVDIGARNFSGGGFGFNNTQFLYENGWKGLSMDIGDYSSSYKGLKGVTFANVDATNADALREAFTKNNVPSVVDYLSHDIDAAAWDGLITLDWDNYKFKCITLEHDAYHRGISIRNKQREFLQDLGYEIIASLDMYEDWYIHPEYVDRDKFSYLSKMASVPRPFPPKKREQLKEIILNG